MKGSGGDGEDNNGEKSPATPRDILMCTPTFGAINHGEHTCMTPPHKEAYTQFHISFRHDQEKENGNKENEKENRKREI